MILWTSLQCQHHTFKVHEIRSIVLFCSSTASNYQYQQNWQWDQKVKSGLVYMSICVPNILGIKLMCQDCTLSRYHPALAIATKFTCDREKSLELASSLLYCYGCSYDMHIRNLLWWHHLRYHLCWTYPSWRSCFHRVLCLLTIYDNHSLTAVTAVHWQLSIGSCSLAAVH